MPYDNGLLLLGSSEKAGLLKEYPSAKKFIKRFYGAKEFIRGIDRWCLWLPTDAFTSEAMAIPPIADRIHANKTWRSKNPDSSVKRLANRPHQFREMNEIKDTALVVPCVSSEYREYLPIGFAYSDSVVSNLVAVVYNCEEWLFAVITSRMHNLWYKYACGKHEARPRYSHEYGYNTFPFPNISEEQKRLLTVLTRNLIAEREKQSDKTLSEMYNKNNMSQSLRQAHGVIDVAIENLYRNEPFVSDDERLDALFALYEEMINAKQE